MLTLPSDIQLLVLDNIRLPSHLKALCLTSKAYCAITTPCLYRKVILNVRDEDLVKRFKKSMQAGARKHLQATRSLTFTDSDPIADPIGVESRPIQPSYDLYYSPPTGEAILRPILDQFPANCLHSFRWLSMKPFDAKILDTICRDQKDTLKHIHITTDDPRAVRSLAHVKTMDIWCHEIYSKEYIQHAFKEFFSQLNSFNHLEKLFLGVDHWHNSGEYLAECFDYQVASSGRLASLRELSFHSIRLNVAFYRGLANTIDFAQLTHLTLWRCESALTFCSEIVRVNNEYRLEHLALDLGAAFTELNIDSLELLLSNCTILKSLCLNWKVLGDRWREGLTRSLEKIGTGLKLLSLHDWSDYDDTMLVDHFEQVCNACPNLEQLGYSISDKYFVKEYSTGFYQNLEPITMLRKLKTLHLRQRFLEPLEYDEWESFTPTIPIRQRRFAESFFKHLQGRSACRNLEAIVIGLERQFDDDHAAISFQPYTPSHCYRRGRMIDQYGRIHDVPYLVSLQEFRATSDHAEVLDWCSEWSDAAFWMWRVPGRFHDD